MPSKVKSGIVLALIGFLCTLASISTPWYFTYDKLPLPSDPSKYCSVYVFTHWVEEYCQASEECEQWTKEDNSEAPIAWCYRGKSYNWQNLCKEEKNYESK